MTLQRPEPGAGPNAGGPAPDPEDGLSPALRAELLDASAWRSVLEPFCRATNLAVILLGPGGSPRGPCINPRPTWSLLAGPRPAGAGACPFAIRPARPCPCLVEARARRSYHLGRDATGLVHVTIPLALGPEYLGALVAGQVFDGYPEQLPLEHAGRQVGLSLEQVWQAARLEHPIKLATLRTFADLLATLAADFLRSRYHERIGAGRLAALTDLSDQLRRRTEELAEASRHTDEFLAMLAHELRNPLAPIRNAVQVLHFIPHEDPNLRWAREVVGRQVQHLSRLVDDLLDVSRFSSGKITLRKEPTDLVAIAADAAETVRPALEARGLELVLHFPRRCLPVDADPTRLMQVLGNLLNNAAKFTSEGGQVVLAAEADGGEAVVRVRDTGIGIPADLLPRVFDLFTQGNATLDRSQGGLGIGLTLVRSLVDLHDGRVEARSAGRGRGSEFVIRLPLLPDSAGLIAAGDSPTDRAAAAAPRRILVVDDNQDAARSLSRWLELTGHDVRVAHDGPAALDAARDFRPEVVLLDIGLPVMDGFEVGRRLRAGPETKDVRLVALTGYGQDEDRRRSRDIGFDHHLLKPVDPDALKRLLATLEVPAS